MNRRNATYGMATPSASADEHVEGVVDAQVEAGGGEQHERDGDGRLGPPADGARRGHERVDDRRRSTAASTATGGDGNE